MGLEAAARGSDKWPENPAFCAITPGAWDTKKNVPTGETGGATGTRVKHSQCDISMS
jgi:hypothetical protein